MVECLFMVESQYVVESLFMVESFVQRNRPYSDLLAGHPEPKLRV